MTKRWHYQNPKETLPVQIPLRLTEEMRAQVEARAQRDGVSIAEWIRGAVAKRLGWRYTAPGDET